MDNTGLLLIDVLSILPEGVDCYLQAPSLEDEVIVSIMNEAKFANSKSIKLDGKIKEKFIERIINYSIIEYFHRVEIRNNNKLLFEGYDGIEYGLISKSIIIPEWFIEKHIKSENCIISEDW